MLAAEAQGGNITGYGFEFLVSGRFGCRVYWAFIRFSYPCKVIGLPVVSELGRFLRGSIRANSLGSADCYEKRRWN